MFLPFFSTSLFKFYFSGTKPKIKNKKPIIKHKTPVVPIAKISDTRGQATRENSPLQTPEKQIHSLPLPSAYLLRRDCSANSGQHSSISKDRRSVKSACTGTQFCPFRVERPGAISMLSGNFITSEKSTWIGISY